MACPVSLVYEPAEHGDGSVLPAPQACPTGQGVHSDEDDRLVASEKLPASDELLRRPSGHGKGADAPSRQ